MRNRLMMSTAALLLASASLAFGQAKQQPQQPQQQQQEQPALAGDTTGGVVDVAGRFTSTDGDSARYERYRDLRSGVNANLLYSKVTADYIFNVTAQNVGYRDQRYTMAFNSKKFKGSFFFNQIPLNYGFADDNITRTPYQCSAGSCTLDVSARTGVENKALIGIPANVSQLGNPSKSVYDGLARAIDLKSLRSTIGGNLIYSATDNLDLTFDFNTFSRTGNMPWGASFAFPVGIELPLEIDNRTTNVTAGIEWASHQGMMRVSYDYSKFNQNIPYLDWDNPQRATDFCKTGISGQAPGTCYDPSGYSNGNGPADGRMAMPPTNTLNTFAFLGMVKLPNHTTANASFQMGANNQDAALIPWTTNPVIANQTVYNTFPGLASLPRDTAQMAVNYATATMNVNSRVNKYLNVAARYRYNSRNDFTRGFDAVEYVRFDAVPEETGGETEPFHINRNTFDVNASVTPFRYGAIRFGYGYDKWQHTVRATEAWRDNTYRISYDGVVNQYVTLRLLYENINRESQNLHVGDITDAGGQDALRFYDEASRDRNRATFIVEVNPLPMLGINFTAATAKDDYQGADPSQQFGLLDNKNDAFTIGFNVAPNAMVNFGMDYGRETYHSLQQSRNANPAPDPSWTDPNRNWTLTNDEHVNNFQLYANLVNALPKTDIRVGYDFSDSDQAFVHGGPRIATLQTLNTFVALPNVTNSWNRFTVDAKHDINKKLGVGFTYWYEKFDVKDFATINSAGPQTLPVAALGTQTDQPRVDWLGGLVTGYGNRPYTGQTGFVRVYYMF